MVPRWQTSVMLGWVLLFSAGVRGYTDQTFRAAVYEHAPLPPNRTIVVTRQEALNYMRKNLEVYKTATEEAHEQVSIGTISPIFPLYPCKLFKQESKRDAIAWCYCQLFWLCAFKTTLANLDYDFLFVLYDNPRKVLNI